ncbi:MAG: hypothetical protein AABP62_14815 [Planctomycetota bacterium]
MIAGFASPSLAEVPNKKTDAPAADKPRDAARDSLAMMSFAPMWRPVPKFPIDPNAQEANPIPSHIYSVIWQPQWQKELDLSADQMQSLLPIKTKALADTQRNIEQFKKLSPEEQKAEVKSWAGKPAPWRQQFESEYRKQIESILTPQQVQTIKAHTFPEYAVSLLYDPRVRQEIAFSPDQENRVRGLVHERFARIQEESLKRAEKVWGLLSPQQQAELPEVVKRQGPTSAILSIGWDLGFNFDNFVARYPMLAQSPVRERLRLSPEQAKQLQAVMADAGARVKKARQEGEGNPPGAEDDDQKRVDAILTPEQLTMLVEINFRRQVVLALGYPEKRESIGMTDQQQADLQRLDKESSEQQYRIDREMLGKVLEIITPPQREQLIAEIDRRGG